MVISSIASGLRAIGKRPGLTALLFLLNFALAVVLAAPIGIALDVALRNTGFDADMAGGLDFVLLMDILQNNPDIVAVTVRQLLWILPLLLVWKAAVGVGLVQAVRGDASGSFWAGVGRHFGRSFGLGVVHLLMAGIVIGLSIIVGLVISAASGEVWTWRAWAIVVPVLVAGGLGKLDMMQDYGRVAIVLGDRGVFPAFIDGIRFPIRHGWAFLLYLLWALPAALVWLAPTLLEAAFGATLAVFFLQQVLMLARAGLTVGWLGAEVAYFETVAAGRMPYDPVDVPETPVGFA